MGARVLQVVTDTDRRGAQIFACDLHDALERKGVAIRTVALAAGAVGGLDLPVLGPERLSAKTLLALRGELGRSSVAIAHGSSTLPACAVAGIAKRTPFVYRQISDSRFWAAHPLRQFRVQWGLARSAAVVSLWQGAAQTLSTYLKVPREKITVVPNGVADARFEPATDAQRRAARVGFGLEPDCPTVVSIGALVPEKGVDLAISSVAATDRSQLLVVGDGPERDALEALATRVSRGRVVFAGSIADSAEAYKAADVVVIPSRAGDSMPAVAIEAGMMALPVIATPVEAIPEVVLDGRTGVIVPINEVDQLVRALERMIEAPAQAAAFGREARDHCLASFSIGVIAEQWLEVLRGVAGSSL